MLKLKLEELLEEKSLTRYWLSQETEISYPTIDRYYKNKTSSYDNYILNAICNALDCQPADLFEYQKDEK